MSKKTWNLLFALIVIGLGLTAVISLYLKPDTPVFRATERGGGSDSMPENHPPVETAQKLAALIEMGSEDPQNAQVQAEIGNIYYDMGEYDRAVTYYQRSLALEPANPYVETDLATCFHYTGRDDEALEMLDNVLQYRPGFPQALYNKGIVLIHGKNDIETGIAAWEELLESDLEPARRAELEQSIQQLKASVR